VDADHEGSSGGPSVAGDGTIRAIAEAAVLGLPVQRMVLSRDGDEVAFWDAVRVEAVKVYDTHLTNLARKIVEEHSKAEERGRKKKPGG
jgi:hypothetical protein